jgi:hypothetical protein
MRAVVNLLELLTLLANSIVAKHYRPEPQSQKCVRVCGEFQKRSSVYHATAAFLSQCRFQVNRRQSRWLYQMSTYCGVSSHQ